MNFIYKPLSKEEIEDIQKEFGDYVKITLDLENGWMVVGSELHADGEKELLLKGSSSDNIWGGGINLKDKTIDATAVLNLRPRLGNDSMEVLDPIKRQRFFDIIKKYFVILWR